MKYLIIIILFTSLIFPEIHHRCPEYQERDDRPDLEIYYESPSGHFWIHYDLNTDNAPDLTDLDINGTPDYIEQVALAADSARYVLTQEMGFIDESHDEDEKYDPSKTKKRGGGPKISVKKSRW